MYYLAGNLGRQEGQNFGCGSIVCYPHQILVDQNGVVVPCFACGSSVADVCHGDVFGAGPQETVQGSWDRVWSMWIEGPFVFGNRAFDGDQFHLVITEILPQALISPAIQKLLPGNLIKEFVRVVHDERQLYMLSDIAPFFDLRVAVLHRSCLGVYP